MYEAGDPSRVVVRARRAPRRASTLIELLVVISVVGFLIALLLPSLKRSTDLAAAAVCRHQLKQIGVSLRMYRDENNGWLPTLDAVNQTAAAREPEPWFNKLFPTYLPDPAVLRCPRDPLGGLSTVSFSGSMARNQPRTGFASYGLNNFLLTAAGGALAQVDRYQPKRPLDTILSADLGPDNGEPTSRFGQNAVTQARAGGVMMWGDGFDPFSPDPPSTWLTTRHGSGIHMLTLDGGVRDVRTTEVLRTKIARTYPYCAAGGCTLCREYRSYHYSFAKDQLFWWTGPIPD